MTIDQKELETILLLDAEDRNEFFFDQISETGLVWGLCGEGWASFLDDAQGIQLFPIWSDQELAEVNAKEEWEGFEGKSFTLQQFVEELIPELLQANMQLSIFKIPADSGFIAHPEVLSKRLASKFAS